MTVQAVSVCLQTPCQFDNEVVLRQLRYTGMMETVKIRKAGYSVRTDFEVRTHVQLTYNLTTLKMNELVCIFDTKSSYFSNSVWSVLIIVSAPGFL